MHTKLLESIEGLRGRSATISFDEAKTKQTIILKLLSTLGWDIFNIDEVEPEYEIAGKSVDYSLRTGNVNKVFIEVKRIGEPLEKHQKQLLDYAFMEGVKLAILTNGEAWWFYLPLHEGSWEQRKFYSIDIMQQDPEDVSSKFIDFLSKENVSSDKAIQRAESIYRSQQKKVILQETFPKAWNKIVSESDELLMDLINETTEMLCGYKADVLQIEEFISTHIEQLMISAEQPEKTPPYTPESIRPRIPPPIPRGYTGKKISAFSFKGRDYKVNFWKEMLFELCNTLVSIHGNDFDKTLNLVGRERPYFTRNADELRIPQRINKTDIYVETNLSANSIVRLCQNLVSLFGYSSTDINIELG